MKRILFVTDSHLLNTKSVDFACYIALLTHSALAGLFVEEEMLELVPLTGYKHTYVNEVKSD